MADPPIRAAIVLAAGRGVRMGADKALLQLGDRSAIERVVETCRSAGLDQVVVVRREGAQAVADLGVAAATMAWKVVSVGDGGSMADSVRAGGRALAPEVTQVLVWAVDHPLVAADTIAALLAALDRPPCAVALPLWRERPGHPLTLSRPLLGELGEGPSATLRDVVRRDPDRVQVVPTNCPWTVRDLDTPADLRAARAALSEQGWPVQEQMHRHRSRRQFDSAPLPAEQVARWVDAARHASTSSFIQAYSVVSVTDPDRRQACAVLCADQDHVREAPVFLAICADVSRLAQAAAAAGGDFAHGDFELFVQATVDAALVAQNIQLAAEAEGLGSCMIGAARNHPRELARLLDLPPQAYVVMGLTLGRALDDPVPRTRMPLPGVLHRERYDHAASAAAAAAADEQMREWARRVNSRAAPGARTVDERKGWRDRMARIWRADGPYVRTREHLRQELARLGVLRDPPPEE